MPKLNEIQMRDPFVLRHDPEGRYYLYGSTDPDIWKGRGIGFDVVEPVKNGSDTSPTAPIFAAAATARC